MKCYECKWLDRSVILTSNPPQYGCTLGFGSHYADHECEYDFMPIVRCKDCKWFKPNQLVPVHPLLGGGIVYENNCERCLGIVPNEDDYCSRGERKEL